ncbi:Thioesterase/thiol ester dehydrase-isomerase [Hypoxylon sp. FL1150]|nr:Thioesterase/thiol ester dehydrase-isomerase [Hypoxylon sp. FL1150]
MPDGKLKSHLDYFISQGIKSLQAPNIVPFIPPPRLDTSQSPLGGDVPVSQDTLFRYSLDSENTIPHYIGFYEDPFHHSPTTFPHLPFITTSVSLILELRDGVHGFNATLHGGLSCAILDEAMGALIFQNGLLNDQAKAEGLIPPDAPGFSAAGTARMDVKYRRPIKTPQIVVVTATLVRVEGRKISMHVVLKDRNGQECVSCDGMFITFSKGKL